MHVPVLVVGAGPVGLALAGDLGWRGVPCLLVERGDGSITQPKMDLVGVRTMEFCRRWGIVDWVEGSPYPRDYPQDYVYVTSLSGYELGRERFPALQDERCPPQSPQKRERCPQDMFDPILTRFAQSFPGVTIRYNTEATGITETDHGVEVVLRDAVTGESVVVTADYVVGCDGAASTVRSALGADMVGQPALTYTTNVIFRCPDLPTLHDKGLAYRFICIGPEGTYATLVAINGADRWRLSHIGDETKRKLSDEEVDALIRRVVGADLEYEVLSVVPWVRRELVATSYGTRRVFIAGDAAHLMSPTGGFGMNTGIGDAVDLAWKLEAVLSGWADPGLLASYDAERRPVAVRNVAEATRNLGRMLGPRTNRPPAEVFVEGPEGEAARRSFGKAYEDSMRPEWYSIGVHLGYRYDDSPIVVADGTPAPDCPVSTYVPIARPGARAPHVWLPDGRSTLDLFGRGFVLLRIGPSAPAAPGIQAALSAAGVPLDVHTLAQADVLEAYEQPLVLVRPDGHVAWRGHEDPVHADDVVRIVLGARVGAVAVSD
jgi:2-polyprenyl-6-methoxyphenol hydroxylase-like FAD-dependent oxidoreductase